MLAELVRHVIGVDPDRDRINLAVVDAATTGVIAHGRFPATAAGYEQAVELADAHGEPTERAWAIEGTASYGRDLTMALQRRGEWVIEFDRPTRKSKAAPSPIISTPCALPVRHWAATNIASREPTTASAKPSVCTR